MDDDVKAHPITKVAENIIRELSNEDVATMEEELAEGVLDLETSEACQSLLETWTAIKQGEMIPERDVLALAVFIQQMALSGYADDSPLGERDSSEDWKN